VGKLTVLFFLWLSTSLAATKVVVPYLSGPLVDEVGLLSSSEKARIEQVLLALKATQKAQMVVLIANSLQGFEIEDYSIAVAEAWKLGKKSVDNGLLLIIAPNERRMRLEVGYGLEGNLPDAISIRLLDETLKPYFKAQQFGNGIMALLSQIGERVGALGIAGEINREIAPPPQSRQQKRGLPVFAWIIIAIFLLITRSQRRRGLGGYFGGGFGGGGGGGFGGGGFSGGGGGFGGGGASSRW
jgi:uncharacterized protein